MIRCLKVNYNNRIHIAFPAEPTDHILPDTVLKARNSSGEMVEIFAQECTIFETYKFK